MKNSKIIRFMIIAFILLAACGKQADGPDTEDVPAFRNVTVHDPSVIKADGQYYVFGSHLASAKSADLIEWTQISSSAVPGNKLIPNAKEEMAEALEWAQSETFWAPDVIRLNDGRYYMYYCSCRATARSPPGYCRFRQCGRALRKSWHHTQIRKRTQSRRFSL